MRPAGIKREPCSVAVTLNACSVAMLEFQWVQRRKLLLTSVLTTQQVIDEPASGSILLVMTISDKSKDRRDHLLRKSREQQSHHLVVALPRTCLAVLCPISILAAYAAILRLQTRAPIPHLRNPRAAPIAEQSLSGAAEKHTPNAPRDTGLRCRLVDFIAATLSAAVSIPRHINKHGNAKKRTVAETWAKVA